MLEGFEMQPRCAKHLFGRIGHVSHHAAAIDLHKE